MEQELVSGTIAAVVFENPENGYAVVKLDSDDGGLITVVGTIPAPAAGERLIVTGKWTAHATYGRQPASIFIMDSAHLVLSALPPERFAPKEERENEE